MSRIHDAERAKHRLSAARAKIGKPGLRLLGACLPRVFAPLARVARTCGTPVVVTGIIVAGISALPSSDEESLGAIQSRFGVTASVAQEPSTRDVPAYMKSVADPDRPTFFVPAHERHDSVGDPHARKDGGGVHQGDRGEHYSVHCAIHERAEKVGCVRQASSTARTRDAIEERLTVGLSFGDLQGSLQGSLSGGTIGSGRGGSLYHGRD